MKKTLIWATRIIPAIILFQTLFFKFSGAAESKFIFSTLGLEPYGRIGIGILELIAVILILNPKTTLYGAILSLGLMGGAIMSHLTQLGIEVQGDGGYLFVLALVVAIFSAIIIFTERANLITLISNVKNIFIK